MDDGTWLDWLGADPVAIMSDEIKRLIIDQIEGAVVDNVHFTSNFKTLMTTRKSPEDPNRLIVNRAGVGAYFQATVQSSNNTPELLEGYFTWVAAGIATDRRSDQTYLDIGQDSDMSEDFLKMRLFEVGSEIEMSTN